MILEKNKNLIILFMFVYVYVTKYVYAHIMFTLLYCLDKISSKLVWRNILI